MPTNIPVHASKPAANKAYPRDSAIAGFAGPGAIGEQLLPDEAKNKSQAGLIFDLRGLPPRGSALVDRSYLLCCDPRVRGTGLVHIRRRTAPSMLTDVVQWTAFLP